MLYIVGTPIGNIEDLSYRQGKLLAEADYILTEDTRSTGQLLIKIRELFNFDINPAQRLVSYYKDKEFEKLPQIIELLEQENDVCLISEAGMPLISDPGYILMKTIIQKGLPYTVIPGPSAVTTALIHAGYKTDQWMFIGFLPKRENDLVKLIKNTKEVSGTMKNTTFIAFESPSRIKITLELFSKHYPECHITVTRELTKKFEEVKRGSAQELQQHEYKGEITLVFHF